MRRQASGRLHQRGGTRVTVAATLALLAAGAPKVARGEATPLLAADGVEDSVPYRLIFKGPPGCADEPRIRDQVRLRTSRVHDAAEGEKAVVFAATFRTLPRRAEATLVIRDTDGNQETRALSGPTCAEAVDAVALVIALTLDPEARMDLTKPEDPISERPAPPRRRRVGHFRETSSAASSTWTFLTGVREGTYGGISPTVAFGGGAFVGTSYYRSNLATVTLLAGVERAVGLDVSSSAGSARFSLTTGIFQICAFRAPLARDLFLQPCAGVQVGVHRGDRLGSAVHQSGLWLTPELLLRGEWRLFSWGAGEGGGERGSVYLEAQGGVLVPLRRTRYYFVRQETLYDVPSVAWVAQLGLGVHFR